MLICKSIQMFCIVEELKQLLLKEYVSCQMISNLCKITYYAKCVSCHLRMQWSGTGKVMKGDKTEVSKVFEVIFCQKVILTSSYSFLLITKHSSTNSEMKAPTKITDVWGEVIGKR